MEETKQVRFSGLGGQGILLAGSIFARAALDDWEYVSGSTIYGANISGGLCAADVVLSQQPISYPKVLEADVLVTMSQQAYGQYVTEVSQEGIVFYDSVLAVEDIPGLRQVSVPAVELAARELNNVMTANMIMLGVVAQASKIIGFDAVVKIVGGSGSEAFREVNVSALKLGFDYKIG